MDSMVPNPPAPFIRKEVLKLAGEIRGSWNFVDTMAEIQSYEQYEKMAREAAALYNAKQYDKALVSFQLLAKHNYENFKLHETLANIYLKLNDYTAAEKEFRIALELAKKETAAPFEFRSFEQVVAELPKKAVLEEQYNVLLKEKDTQTLVSQTRSVIQLAILYMDEQKYDEAERVLSGFKKRVAMPTGA